MAFTVSDLFQQHYDRFVEHVRRHLRDDELTEEIPRGAIDPRDIVEEAACQAATRAGQKPVTTGWLVWFFQLIHEELRRQRDALKQQEREEISVEARTNLPENIEDKLQPMEQVVVEQMEPEVILTEDTIPDPEATPPDQVAATRDLLEQLQEVVQTWPRPEREIFDLRFVEGFTAQEIVRITGQPLSRVREKIGRFNTVFSRWRH